MGPAQAVVVILIVLVEAVQGALEIVHCSIAVPAAAKAVTPDVGDVGVVIVAVPDTTDHKPVPTVGVFPANVAVVTPQAGFWFGPALDAVGFLLNVTFTSSNEAAQGALEIVQRKV